MSNRRRYFWDQFFKQLFKTAAFFSILILLGIFFMLLYNGWRTFEEVSIFEFLGDAHWNPSAYGEASYGMGGMLLSTLLVTAGSLLIAVPIGVATAAYLSELAPRWVRRLLKPTIEMLAAIPSVALGFIGIVLIGPALAALFNLDNGMNALNGSILLAFMALPTIVTVAEDALDAVPNAFKEGSYALGANRWRTLVRITLPAAYPGIIAAIMLGMGRAIGETMTVLMATGNSTALPDGFFSAVRTMTATIAIELGEVPYGTTHYHSLFAIGTVLFLITLAINIIAERIAAGFRYHYN